MPGKESRMGYPGGHDRVGKQKAPTQERVDRTAGGRRTGSRRAGVYERQPYSNYRGRKYGAGISVGKAGGEGGKMNTQVSGEIDAAQGGF